MSTFESAANGIPVSSADAIDDDSDLFEEVSLSATALIQGNCSNATFDPN